jgi:hypothetical protein
MTSALSDMRGRLHDAVCVGVRAGYCPPGDSDHARRTQTDTARRALTGDQVAVVHDAVCPAHLDRATFPGGCPEREQHEAWLRERLSGDDPTRNRATFHHDTTGS